MKFIKLSEGTYGFGAGGCIRFEKVAEWDVKSGYITTLYFVGGVRVLVKESEEYIYNLLNPVDTDL